MEERESAQAYNQRMYGGGRDAGWLNQGYGPQANTQTTQQGRPMNNNFYSSPQYSGSGLMGNPINWGMQNMAMQSMFAPQQIANNVNGAMQNYQAARLYNAPQETARMGIQQQGNNFSQLMSILPQLLGAIGGGGILGPGEQQGFKTNYGAGASMGGGGQQGGGNPHGDDGGKTFHGMLRQYM